MLLPAKSRMPRALGPVPCRLAVIGLCCQGLSFSAPVVDAGADAGPNAGESRAAPSGADARARSGGKAGVTTGDKHLDLLLDLQSSRVDRAASAPGLAKLGVAGGPKEAQPAGGGSNLARDLRREALALQPARAANAGEAHPTAGAGVPAQVQREWVPPSSSGGLGATLGGGAALRGMLQTGDESGGDSRPPPMSVGPADEDVIARLPAKVRAFLRDNRYLIMVGLVALLVAGGAIKLVLRRR